MPPKKAPRASASPAAKVRASSNSRASSSSRPSLARAGASVVGTPKAAPASPTPPAPASPAPEVPAPAEATAAAVDGEPGRPQYEGQPLELKAAEGLLAALAADDMRELAKGASAEEQLPARMMLEFVGDKDLSWQNAQASLRQGEQFKKEIKDMEGANFVTRKSLERMEAVGKLEPAALKDKNPAAFAMAVYLEAVIDAAKEKLGMKATPAAELPPPAAEPPAWPIKIAFKEIGSALSDAVHFRRTPLFVCNGKASTVDTYFSYQACSLVDAKWVLNKVSVTKELDVPAMREELRKRLASALKFGQPIHICMSNSAVAFKEKYCGEAHFPEALFKQDLWFQKDNYSKVLREEDLKDWPGAFPGRMRDDCASFSFVTTDFTVESANEFLPAALPHFQSMAIIEIDPASIN